MTPPIRYLAITGATVLALVGAVAALNAVVDPFEMTRAPARPGFNQNKPAIHQRVRLTKAYDVRHVAPGAVVLGTSRSHLGLRTTHPGWHGAPRYNLAFDGATPREMHAYLLHAHAVRPLQQVVLGLDTWHLKHLPIGTRPGFDPTLLLSDGSAASWLRLFAADARVLASIDTLRASVNTLRAQDWAQPRWLAPDGQRLGDAFFRRAGEMFQDESPRAYFAAYDRQEVGWRRPASPAPGAAPQAAGAPAQPSAMADIGRIVEFCRAQGIDLRIFITPAHVHQMEIGALTGEWPGLEQAKRDLVRMLAADAARHPGRPAVPLWDFSGYSSVTTEPMPAAGSRDEMRYYWDASHFKENVGDWVLARLFGVSDAAAGAPPADFGVLLTERNVETAIAATRAAAEAYRKTRSHEVAQLRTLVDEVLGPRP